MRLLKRPLYSLSQPLDQRIHVVHRYFLFLQKEILNAYVNNANHCKMDDGLPVPAVTPLLMHYSWPHWLECGKAAAGMIGRPL